MPIPALEAVCEDDIATIASHLARREIGLWMTALPGVSPDTIRTAGNIASDALEDGEVVLREVSRHIGQDASFVASAVRRGLIDRLTRVEAQYEQCDADDGAAEPA